jgi:hypothetical protein
MKYLYSLLLLATFSCSSSDSVEEKNRINESALKIRLFDVSADQIYQQNIKLIKQNNVPELEKSIIVFKQFDDSLQLVRDELISAAGGYTTEGLYFNAPAYNYVQDYFYGETAFRNNSHQFFFSTLDNLSQNLNQLLPATKPTKEIENKFDILQKHYGINNRNELFKSLSINEAVELIEAFRRQVAISHQEYVINELIKSSS